MVEEKKNQAPEPAPSPWVTQNIEFSSHEEDLIRAFKKTYNALYIENFSDEKLEYIKRTVNPVYRKLINNLKSPRTYLLFDHLEGPFTVNKFKLEEMGGHKSFYIFGEWHRDSRGHCSPSGWGITEFHTYLRFLSIQSPSFFDVYIETPMVKHTYNPHDVARKRIDLTLHEMIYNPLYGNNDDSTVRRRLHQGDGTISSINSYILNRIKFDFETCIQPDSRLLSEECNIMRIHNIDIRDTWDEITSDLGMEVLYTILNFSSHAWDVKQAIRRIGLQNKFIHDALLDLKTGNIIGHFKKNHRIYTEIEKRTYEKEPITNFIQKKIEDIGIQKIQEAAENCINAVSWDHDFPVDKIRELENILLKLGSLKMDMYALARIFKYYDIEKNNPAGAFQPRESKNIIIYAGDNHAQNYVEFLEYLGSIGREVTLLYRNIGDKNISCIGVPQEEPNPIDTTKYPFYTPRQDDKNMDYCSIL